MFFFCPGSTAFSMKHDILRSKRHQMLLQQYSNQNFMRNWNNTFSQFSRSLRSQSNTQLECVDMFWVNAAISRYNYAIKNDAEILNWWPNTETNDWIVIGRIFSIYDTKLRLYRRGRKLTLCSRHKSSPHFIQDRK